MRFRADVFAIEDTTVQLTWRGAPAGPGGNHGAATDRSTRTLEAVGEAGPGAIDRRRARGRHGVPLHGRAEGRRTAAAPRSDPHAPHVARRRAHPAVDHQRHPYRRARVRRCSLASVEDPEPVGAAPAAVRVGRHRRMDAMGLAARRVQRRSRRSRHASRMGDTRHVARKRAATMDAHARQSRDDEAHPRTGRGHVGGDGPAFRSGPHHRSTGPAHRARRNGRRRPRPRTRPRCCGGRRCGR